MKQNFNVIVLNATAYEDKTTKTKKLRISYVFSDDEVEKKEGRFLGFKDLAVYTDRIDFIDKLRGNFLTPLIFVFEPIPSKYDPTKIYNTLVDIIAE